MYRLVGCVIYHHLSSSAGHYTSYIYNSDQNVWFFMNDEKVSSTLFINMIIYVLIWNMNIIKATRVELEEVLSKDPSLLIYEKCGMYFFKLKECFDLSFIDPMQILTTTTLFPYISAIE